MIILEGKSLCVRQKELNRKVYEAAHSKADFQVIKAAQECSDVDRLFKIDLASKYRNTDYLIEQLKCGDSLYITRVLKSKWVYSKEYAHIINPDYLQNNIFPSMSIKMKKKTLSAIALHVRDADRAQIFFEYCINMKMDAYAYKFLIFTSEMYKKDKIHPNFFPVYYKDVIGNSFILADIYCAKGGGVAKLSYLYNVNDMEYLNLIEKQTYDNYFYECPTLSVKISRTILKKHKTKILNNPVPYLRVIKRSVLVKLSSSDDAQVYAAALLPDNVRDYWRSNYYGNNKDILDLIKTDSLYTFMKQIFSNKYPKEEFEMTKEFYDQGYYKLMTVKEKEHWALMHLDKQTSVIPEDENYQWYEFVEFASAFIEIKKKILITTNEDKRSRMLITLIKSAKSHKELEGLLTYYYKRHVNEKKHLTVWFLSKVCEHHKVLEFDEACWRALDKLFHSVDIYFSDGNYMSRDFRVYSLLYHIINKVTLPNGLCNYLDQLCSSIAVVGQHTQQFSKEKRKIVYDYVLQVLTDKIKGFESLDYNEEVGDKVRQYLKTLIKLKKTFDQGGDYSEIALKYMNLDREHFHYIVDPTPKLEIPQDIKEISPGFLFRCLKQDSALILQKFSLIQKHYEYPFRHMYHPFRCLSGMNKIWKKIKVYFSNDIAKKYVDLCSRSLINMSLLESGDVKINSNLISAHVFAIFQLADEQFKAEFMDKHAPASSKIEYDKISRYLLETQSAICHLHYYSRPPVPLAKTALYLKGDYVSRCKDMFNSYLVHLSPTLLADFICFLLDSPVSIQKRGLRLAFQSFGGSELKELVCNAWKRTKNVSLRSSIYKLIVDKISRSRREEPALFELLIELTSHLQEDDDEESVFETFRCYSMPQYVAGLHLKTAWKTVSAFPDKKLNIQRKIFIVRAMTSRMSLMDQDFVEALINEHASKRLTEKKLRPEENPDIAQLNNALWDFVAEYIVNIPSEQKQEKSLNVLKVIMKECFDNWNETHDTEEYVFQLFFKQFSNKLDTSAQYLGPSYFSRVTNIFQYLVESFEDKFDIRDVYSYYWERQLSLMFRTVINGDLCDKDVHIRFGTELGMFVKKLKEMNCFYTSFLEKILWKISTVTRTLIMLKESSLTDTYVKILIAYGLAGHRTFETLALALGILPQNLPSESEIETPELREVINIIKNQKNDELIALLNEKFIYTDLKVRKILL